MERERGSEREIWGEGCSVFIFVTSSQVKHK
jgi:hypothetical protein